MVLQPGYPLTMKVPTKGSDQIDLSQSAIPVSLDVFHTEIITP